MKFIRPYKIRFAHCDPAGIVFYPQFLVLLNDHVEDWFAEALNCNFQQLHEQRRLGVPTVHLSCDFDSPSRLAETVDISLAISRMGRASVTLDRLISCGDQTRVRVNQVLACLDMDSGKACPWPEDLKQAMSTYHQPQDQ
ncbi:MAG: acyl-CoA thioesterase [Burkholderiaceae bacterium]